MAASVEQQDRMNFASKQTNEKWRTHPDLELVTNFVKNIRDCDFYRQEYKECKSWSGRFHQRYVYGESLDCQQYTIAHRYCQKAQETGDLHALENIIQYELSKRDFRIDCAAANNIWEYRKNPPKSWEYPGENRANIPDEDVEDESKTAELASVENGQSTDRALQDQRQTVTEKQSSWGCVVS